MMKIKISSLIILFTFFVGAQEAIKSEDPAQPAAVEETTPEKAPIETEETEETEKKEKKEDKAVVTPKASTTPKAPVISKDTVQQENEELKKKIALNEERLDELEERLDGVEKATLVDRVSLSMDVRVAVHNFIYKDDSSEKTKDQGLFKKDGESFGIFSMMGRLKMVANLGDTLKFTGWLSMYKQFNESSPYRYQNLDLNPNYDMGIAKYPGDSRVYFERLFIDWYITKWLALSGGRGPGTEGSPSDLRYDTVELSSFPESMISSPVDGFYLTLNIGAISSLKNTYLRLFYVPQVMVTDDITNTFFVTQDNPYLHFFGFNYSMQIPKTTGGKMFLTAGFTPNMVTGEQHADLDGDGEEEKLHVAKNQGKLLAWNVHFKFKEVFNSPVDIFFGTGGSTIFPEARNQKNLNAGFVGTPIDEESGLSTPLFSILGSNLDGKPLVGITAYAGFRISLPLEVDGSKVKLGADYNYGSKNFFMYYAPDFTGTNRFAIKGHHAEGYFIIPLHRKANIKICYLFEKHDHAFTLFAPVGKGLDKIDEKIHGFFFMLNAYF